MIAVLAAKFARIQAQEEAVWASGALESLSDIHGQYSRLSVEVRETVDTASVDGQQLLREVTHRVNDLTCTFKCMHLT